MPLTDAAIRQVKPTEKPQRLFDGGGFYLEVAPSGGKWWRLKYRHGGKEKRLSLGTYPSVTLSAARLAAIAERQKLAAGTDPAEVRKPKAQPLSVGLFAARIASVGAVSGPCLWRTAHGEASNHLTH